MNSNINFNKEEVSDILSRLEEKTNKLKDLYKEVNGYSLIISGDQEIWKGKGQANFYNSFKSITNKFDSINNGFDNCNGFLKTVIDSYSSTENNLETSIEKDSQDLNIN